MYTCVNWRNQFRGYVYPCGWRYKPTTMRNGVKRAIQLGYKKIMIEGHNKMLIHVVCGEICVPWQLRTLVQDIKCFLTQAIDVQVYLIYREGNIVDDWMVK